MGRIKELVNSRDGEVRSAKIVLPNNKVIGRPLKLLFPIECPTTEEAKESIQSYDDVNDRKQDDDQKVKVRPKRDAAMKAEQRTKKVKFSSGGVAKISQMTHIYYLSTIYLHLFIIYITINNP